MYGSAAKGQAMKTFKPLMIECNVEVTIKGKKYVLKTELDLNQCVEKQVFQIFNKASVDSWCWEETNPPHFCHSLDEAEQCPKCSP